MCGLAFTHHLDVSLITDKLKHRGPDNTGKWKYNGIEIGHTRLSILDLSSNGNQPMQTERYVMSFVGEIYNYKDLFSYLNVNDDLADHTLPGDSQVLIKYIQKFGIDKTLRDINGMFAIVLYDKIENKVHLICDRLGQKTIYYYHDNEIFAAASCPSALLHLKEKWRLDEQALASYWKLGATMQHSIWADIKRVYASEIVRYDCGTKQISTTRYWSPEYKPNEDIRELIIDSIKKVKVADVPVYIFLSGGIDSTLCASQFKNGKAIHMDSPEFRYAQQAAIKFNIDLKIASPKTINISESLSDYASKTGEPSMAALIPYLVSKEVKDLGVKVAVSSNAADELFFGYKRTSEQITQIQTDHIFRSCIDYDFKLSEIDDRISPGRWFELNSYVQHDLNKTLDFSSMANGVEVRNPYLDHRLVEAALSTPHEKIGNKKVLKDMLSEMGFDDQYVNRQKMGFSLYVKPNDLDIKKKDAYNWCIQNKFLILNSNPISQRDKEYLQMSALSFYYWHQTFKDKIA